MTRILALLLLWIVMALDIFLWFGRFASPEKEPYVIRVATENNDRQWYLIEHMSGWPFLHVASGTIRPVGVVRFSVLFNLVAALLLVAGTMKFVELFFRHRGQLVIYRLSILFVIMIPLVCVMALWQYETPPNPTASGSLEWFSASKAFEAKLLPTELSFQQTRLFFDPLARRHNGLIRLALFLGIACSIYAGLNLAGAAVRWLWSAAGDQSHSE